jgi:hypothetical protein
VILASPKAPAAVEAPAPDPVAPVRPIANFARRFTARRDWLAGTVVLVLVLAAGVLVLGGRRPTPSAASAASVSLRTEPAVPLPSVSPPPAEAPAPAAAAAPAEMPALHGSEPAPTDEGSGRAAAAQETAKVKASARPKRFAKARAGTKAGKYAKRAKHGRRRATLAAAAADSPVAAAVTAAPAPADAGTAEAAAPDPAERARESYRLGNERLFAGDSAAAASAYEEAIRLAPTDPAGYRGLGLAFAAQGKHADAVRTLRAYLKRAPGAEDRALISERIALLKKKRR